MWTAEHRRDHALRTRRHPSDLSDAEWALMAPLIPPARRGGRDRDPCDGAGEFGVCIGGESVGMKMTAPRATLFAGSPGPPRCCGIQSRHQ